MHPRKHSSIEQLVLDVMTPWTPDPAPSNTIDIGHKISCTKNEFE